MTGRTGKSSPRVVWAAGLTAALAAYSLILRLSGGFDLRLGAVRIRGHDWTRPGIAALALLAYVLWKTRVRVVNGLAQAWQLMCTTAAARTITAVAMVWTVAVSLTFSTCAAGGSDSAGYVSQARLLSEYRLTESIPIAGDWPGDPNALVPLGFVRASSPGVMSSSYPPGLPLLMAPFMIFGDRAVYLLVPAFGLMAIWLVYRTGTAASDPLAGAVAAMLLSVSPVFLYQTLQPMSDVPATACWLAALVFSSRASIPGAISAGGMTSLAILIRPNLAPLAGLLLVAIAISDRHSGWRRALAFALSIVPALLLLGWIQHARYGSAFASGYGALGTLFSASYVGPNLERYPRWLTEVQTPFIWLSALAPFWILTRDRPRRLAWTALSICVGVWLCYLPYFAFGPDEWSYTRFLLPAIPLMLLFAAAVFLWAVRRLPAPLRAPATMTLLAALAFVEVRSAQAHDIFLLRAYERKYPMTGEFVRDHLPPSAVIVAMQHSGSIRHYANRPIVRWDYIYPERLDQTLEILRQRGFAPYAVLDAGEDVEFRAKFQTAGQRSIRRLSPLAVIGDTRVYAFE